MRRLVLLLALGATAWSGAAQAAPCLTTPEAEAVTMAALPSIVRETGLLCRTLPPEALIRQPAGPFLNRMDAEADRAWPAAQAALTRMTDARIAPLLATDLARPMLAALLAPVLIGAVDTAHCPQIDRMLTLLAPLPPRNIAGVIVATAQVAQAERRKKKPAGGIDLPLCAG